MVTEKDDAGKLWVNVKLKDVALRFLHWVYIDVEVRQQALRKDPAVLGILDSAIAMCVEGEAEGAQLAVRTLGPLLCDLFGGYDVPEVSKDFLKRQLRAMKCVQSAMAFQPHTPASGGAADDAVRESPSRQQRRAWEPAEVCFLLCRQRSRVFFGNFDIGGCIDVVDGNVTDVCGFNTDMCGVGTGAAVGGDVHE